MAGFLYYFPDAGAVNTEPQLPAACDLAGVLDGASWSYRDVLRGPDKHRGAVIAVRNIAGTEPRCGYFPDAQTWTAVEPEAGKITHWLGFQNDAKPGPADLLRPHRLPGNPVELADGNEWSVPSVHAPWSKLPRPMRMTPQGFVVGEVNGKYSTICADAARFYDKYMARDLNAPWSEFCAYVWQVLALNYRLGPWEVSALGLVNTSNEMFQSFVEASIGVPYMIAEDEAQKKMPIRPAG